MKNKIFKKIIMLTAIMTFCFLFQVNVRAETLRSDYDVPVPFSEYFDYIKLYPWNLNAFDELVKMGDAYEVESGTKCVILERCVYDSFYTRIVITSGPLRGKEGYVCNDASKNKIFLT